MKPLVFLLAFALLLALPAPAVADGAEPNLEELWKTGSLWQVGDNISKVEQARKAIVAAGDDGLAFAFTKLATADSLGRRCLEAVFKGFGQKALPGLLERMGDGSVLVRRNVALLLGAIDDRGAAPRMVAYLASEKDLRCKVAHLQALARWKEPTALDPLIECTKVAQDHEPLAEMMKARVVPLLANYEDEKAVVRLVELLDDDVYFIRDLARDALVSSKAPVSRWSQFAIPLRYAERPSDELRRRVALLECLYVRSGVDAVAETVRELLACKNELVRGDCALFLAGRGYEIWSELKRKSPRDVSWDPETSLRNALSTETDPYSIACLEKALRRFGPAPNAK